MARAMVTCRVPRARVPLVVDQWPNASGALPKVAPLEPFGLGPIRRVPSNVGRAG